jgi:peptidoglycan/LPS O-acetylase OafA/YrhL
MNKVYFPNLNGLRFFAAFSVMLYHFFGEGLINGHYGVVLFFVLSGFLITYLLFEEKEKFGKIEIKKFYFRRILRIWPLYYLVYFNKSVPFDR